MNKPIPTYHYLAQRNQYFKVDLHTIEVICDYEEKPKNIYTIRKIGARINLILQSSQLINATKYNAVRDFVLKVITTHVNAIDNSIEPGPNS